MTQTLVEHLVEKYGKKRSSLLPILEEIVRRESYLTPQAMVEVARALELSNAEVYGVATFYSFLDTQPRGKYKIRICKSLTCGVKNREVLKELKKLLMIEIGGTTLDRKFSLLMTNCIGQCDHAPAMMINEKVYTDLTPEKIREIIKMYKQEKL